MKKVLLNMERVFRASLLLCLVLSGKSGYTQNQGVNNWWIQGYASNLGLPNGNIRIDFNWGVPMLYPDSLEMSFKHTHANISDAQGNLLFYTNGAYIANAIHDTMMNGGGINPGAYANFVPDGFAIPQGAMILKKPGWNNLYLMFHGSVDNYPGGIGSIAFYLYCTTIDLSLNSGLGGVINKNEIIISDSLNAGKIAATKHANGRDWWVMVHRVNTNKFYKLLVTPYGIDGPYSQDLGIIRNWDAGQAWFSPDGNRYAYFYRNGGLEIFDFDRCTGLLSNPVWIDVPPESGYNVGMAISPNSNVLYVSNVFHIYQFDLNAPDIAASKDTVAAYDGFLSAWPPAPPLATLFGLAALAPDGKIYITTGNSTFHMHAIDNPDVLGVGCNVNQHSVQLPAFYFNTLPNHPNYFLGKIPGSPCDTITGVGMDEPPGITVSVYPNPSNGMFTLSFPVQSEAGLVEVYDVDGKLVFKDYLAPWSQFKRMELSHLPNGIYMCRIKWGTSSASIKIIKE